MHLLIDTKNFLTSGRSLQQLHMATISSNPSMWLGSRLLHTSLSQGSYHSASSIILNIHECISFCPNKTWLCLYFLFSYIILYPFPITNQ